MSNLVDRSDDELSSIIAHTDAVFDELATELDQHPAVAEALRVLIESETMTEDFVVLMTAQPGVGQRVLMAGLSALVNVHTRTTVKNELDRRRLDG